MATNTIPISNVVNVSLTGALRGISEVNVNSVALFTTESPSNGDFYRVYENSSQVELDYGTNAVTTQMANNVFAQSPNILTGGGRLVIIPLLSAVSATAGDFATLDVSANLSNFQSVTDGSLRVVLNGVNRDLTGLNFTNVVTLDDIAAIIGNALVDVSVSQDAGVFTFASKKVGASSAVTLGSVGSGTDLSAAGYFDQATGTATAGVDATGETVAEAITRIGESVFYVGAFTNLDMEDAILSALASTVQAQDKIFVHHVASPEDIAGVVTTITSAEQYKTRLTLYTESIAAANLAKAAFVGRAFSVATTGSDTSQTLELKRLVNVVPDGGINQTLYTQAEAAGAEIYVDYAGGFAALHTSGANRYFDEVYLDLALKFGLETAGFNYLSQTSTKAPQTERGVNGLAAAYTEVLERFVNNGYVGLGLSWNSSERFGNIELFDENITNKGYYLYSLPISQQSQTDREQRKAPLIQIAVKRAGAIHSSDIIVRVEA